MPEICQGSHACICLTESQRRSMSCRPFCFDDPRCFSIDKKKVVGKPKLAIRLKEDWIDIYRHANTDLMSGIGSESGPSFQFIIQSLFSDKDDNPYF